MPQQLQAKQANKQESTQQKSHFAFLTETAHMIRYVNSLEKKNLLKNQLLTGMPETLPCPYFRGLSLMLTNPSFLKQ